MSEDFRKDTIKVHFKYKDGIDIKIDLDRELDYEIMHIEVYRNGSKEDYENIEELYSKNDELLDRILKSYAIWLLYNFNKELSSVKEEGIKFCDMIDTWVEAIDDILSPSLLATTYNPDRKDSISAAIDTLINSYNEVITFLHSALRSHCKRLSKFIKGLHRFKSLEKTKEIFYEVYNYWLGSEHRDKALEKYNSYGLEKILIDFLPITVKFRLLDIGKDPFNKLNFLAGINLQICKAYEVYYPIINSHLNMLEHLKDLVSELEEVTPADIDKIYDRIIELADEASKISIALRGIYVNLEAL